MAGLGGWQSGCFATHQNGWTYLLAFGGTYVAGPLLGLMYLSAILTLTETGRWAGIQTPLSRMGRMALTCYLLESLWMSVVMAHWGLARFGANTWSERFVWLIGIYYIIILFFANFWMSRYQMGPLEWIWRIFTYMKTPPLRKTTN